MDCVRGFLCHKHCSCCWPLGQEDVPRAQAEQLWPHLVMQPSLEPSSPGWGLPSCRIAEMRFFLDFSANLGGGYVAWGWGEFRGCVSVEGYASPA